MRRKGWLVSQGLWRIYNRLEGSPLGRLHSKRAPLLRPRALYGGMKTVCLSRSQNYSATIRSRTVYGPELWPRLWLMEDEWKSETIDFELVSRAWKIFHKALPSCLINPFQQYIFRRNIVANVWPVSRRYLSESKISPIPIFWFEEMIEWSNLFGYLLNSN